MDYEKKYNEALERAKKKVEESTAIYGKNCAAVQLIQEVFPELRESEDERIRKELIEAFERYDIESSWNGFPVKSILAYLEKQKVNTEGDFGRGYDCGYQAGYAVAKNEMRPKVATATLDSEKQKEQKPIDPSDDELQRHQDELYDFKVFAAKQAKEHHISFVHDFEWHNFCAEILSYFNEQKPAECIPDSVKFEEGFKTGRELGFREGVESVKPAEWSEDDEAHMVSLLTRLEGMCKKGATFTKTRFAVSEDEDWLKSLRPSWKPSEWNKEDKNRHYYLCNLLRETWDKVDKGSCIDDAISWLEELPTRVSLSSWKPTEEQMNAIDRCVDYLEESDNEDAEIMESLQEQLNQLKQ